MLIRITFIEKPSCEVYVGGTTSCKRLANANLFSAITERARRRRAYVHLLDLEDRLLADIGLSRHDVVEMRNGRKASSRS